ncbi:MAG: HIG1 domain-containing protein [Rhodospirillales bacterium]
MMQMEGVLPWLLGFAMFATLVVLVVGVVSFGVHGHFYQRHSNNLMRLRVVLQGIAVAIFALITFLAVK